MTWFWTFWMSKKKPTLSLNLFMTWKHFLQRYFSYWLFQIIYYIIDGTLFVYFVAQQSIILINKNKWIFVYSFFYIYLSICIYQNLTCNKDLQINKALWVGCACSFSTMKSKKQWLRIMKRFNLQWVLEALPIKSNHNIPKSHDELTPNLRKICNPLFMKSNKGQRYEQMK